MGRFSESDQMHAVVLFAVSVISLLTQFASAMATEPGYFPPIEKVEGKTYAEWSATWWQWVCAVPKDRNPLIDAKGEHAGSAQFGPVFFLAGTFKNEAMKRTSEVPAERPILVPLLNMLANDAFGIWKDDQLTAQVKEALDTATDLRLLVDGKPVEKLERFRVRTGVFKFSGPEKADDAVHPSIFGKQRAVSDGYWVMLKPLSLGEHTIEFGGKMKKPEFTSDISYKIKVVALKK